ncbi:MAG: DUF3810 domain-containing protein [Clostridiaceae bacterium]|nr:DUF3810 domain-containing protein [Clostridiaceae bacterium]
MGKKKQSSNNMKVRLGGSLIFLSIAASLTVFLLILRAIAFNNSKVADFYTGKIFTPLATAFTWLTSLLPFSLTEFFIILGLPFLLGLLVYGLIRLLKNKSNRGIRFLRTCIIAAAVALIFFSLFIAFHGINYARSPLADTMNLEIKERSVDELEAAMRTLGQAAAAVRESLPEDSSGRIITGTTKDLQQSAHLGWEIAGNRWPALDSTVRSRPKGVLLSKYWSYTKIVGMYMPLLVEANINIDQPAFMIPASTAHELAHTRGFAREDETDFAGLLSCFVHPDPAWQYSGLISAWKDLSRKLAAEDRERWSQAYTDTVTEAMARDLESEYIYWEAYETPVAQVSTQINDAYLKANRETEGVKSYGGVVDLLLAWLETDDADRLFSSILP